MYWVCFAKLYFQKCDFRQILVREPCHLKGRGVVNHYVKVGFLFIF